MENSIKTAFRAINNFKRSRTLSRNNGNTPEQNALHVIRMYEAFDEIELALRSIQRLSLAERTTVIEAKVVHQEIDTPNHIPTPQPLLPDIYIKDGESLTSGQRITIYYNSTKGNWSIKNSKNLVIGYAQNIILKNAKFKVQKATMEKYLNGTSKNSNYKYITGNYSGTLLQVTKKNEVEFIDGEFTTNGEPVTKASVIQISGKSIFI